MEKQLKRAFAALLVIVSLLVSLGCATVSVGTSYEVPVTSHEKAGLGFGIGF
jgi:hypothetical protein